MRVYVCMCVWCMCDTAQQKITSVYAIYTKKWRKLSERRKENVYMGAANS